MNDLLGRRLEEATAANTTLIDFQFFDNKFELRSIRIIQDNLLRNKALFDAKRLKEWKERKLMNEEDKANRIRQIELDSKKEKDKIDEESKE